MLAQAPPAGPGASRAEWTGQLMTCKALGTPARAPVQQLSGERPAQPAAARAGAGRLRGQPCAAAARSGATAQLRSAPRAGGGPCAAAALHWSTENTSWLLCGREDTCTPARVTHGTDGASASARVATGGCAGPAPARQAVCIQTVHTVVTSTSARLRCLQALPAQSPLAYSAAVHTRCAHALSRARRL